LIVPVGMMRDEMDRFEVASTREVDDVWYYFQGANVVEEGDTTPGDRESIPRHANDSNMGHG